MFLYTYKPRLHPNCRSKPALPYQGVLCKGTLNVKINEFNDTQNECDIRGFVEQKRGIPDEQRKNEISEILRKTELKREALQKNKAIKYR